MKHILTLLVASVLCGTTAYCQTSIYVSPTGSSSGNGSTTATAVNLTRAQARVREINAALTADVNVLLLPGTYTLSAPLSFTELDSGSGGFTVRWTAYDTNDLPLISGGQAVTGWSQIGTSGVWAASVPTVAFRQLYVNGQRRQRARSEDFLSVKGTIRNTLDNTRTILVESSSLPATIGDPARAELHSYIEPVPQLVDQALELIGGRNK